MKKYFLQTFGCAMNSADSEKIHMLMLQSGFVKVTDWKDADLVILNTCSVRQKWEDRVVWLLWEIKKYAKKSWKKIITALTGCMIRRTGMAEKYLNEYKRDREKAKKINLLKDSKEIFNNDDKLFPRLKTLDTVFRIEDLKYFPLILSHIFKESIWKDYAFSDYLKAKQLRENPAQATIIIQTGCDNYCTYCIVPYTRGKEISRPIEEIVQEAKTAVKEWAKEITLVGQNVNSYWKQWVDKKYWNEEKGKWNDWLWKSPFRELLEELNKIEWLDRIRFTSSNPHDMTRDILDAHFELPKMCNYLHFALQSGSDEMLKKMNRKHTYKEFKEMVDYLRSKDPYFAISTDIIVGFSWETEEMFEDTVKAFKECEFDFVYIARYSVRKGTIAAKVYPDDIPENIKAQRWHKLNDLLLESIQKRNKMMIGREEEILVSWKKEGQFFGRTRNFKEVFFRPHPNPLLWEEREQEQKEIKIWDIVKVKITDLDKYVLKGELI